MTAALRLAWAGTGRAPGRTLVRIAVLSIAAALIGSMVLFLGHSLRTMTASAVRSVPLDWQGPVTSYPAAKRVAAKVGMQGGVAQASPAATAPFAGATSRGAGTTNAGSGSILAVPTDYSKGIDTFRVLRGSLQPGQVLLDQQLAATLRARVGGTVSLRPTARSRPISYRVSGVALITAPDQVFQPLNPQLGPAPAQPPANAVVMPIDTFAHAYAHALRPILAASAGASAQPGAQTGIQWQVQAQLAEAPLTSRSPSAALKLADQTRNRVERSLPGQVQFVDNLSDGLNTAAGDALYSSALFIMLAVPGALVALGLAYLAGLGTADRDRRDLSLLRARGASRGRLLALAGIESGAIGLIAGLIGTGIALAAVSALFSGGVGVTVDRGVVAGVVCIAVATVGAATARLGATVGALRSVVVEGRRSARRRGRPLWQRLYLDVLALAISGLVYWLTARTGFSAVINPDSNPTLSLSIYMFLAPALLWIGATLLLVRLRGRVLTWATRRAAGGRTEDRAGFLLASASGRGAAINRGLVIVGLLLAFGVSLGIFAATYDRQSNVDAQLTLGADVVATAPPGISALRGLPNRIAAVPGVKATSAVDHSYAYVGPDLQDTYGVDPASLPRATTLRDSYFLGGTASQMMQRLAKRPDGILVSKETITDYALHAGDLLKLRVLDRRTGRFKVVPFHVLGVVQEFPSAPRDSFMVTNLSYLTRVTHDPGANVVFAKTSGDSALVAQRVAAATQTEGTIVKNIKQQAQQVSSSITAVNLSGISHIEEAFAILVAAGAMALFVALGLSERRHEFATMAALGAPLSRVGAFLWSEAALVLGVGMVLAAGLGWLLSEMQVAMLKHVFDPPPDSLAIPWAFLGELAAAATVAALIACALAMRGLRRIDLGRVLREP